MKIKHCSQGCIRKVLYAHRSVAVHSLFLIWSLLSSFRSCTEEEESGKKERERKRSKFMILIFLVLIDVVIYLVVQIDESGLKGLLILL